MINFHLGMPFIGFRSLESVCSHLLLNETETFVLPQEQYRAVFRTSIDTWRQLVENEKLRKMRQAIHNASSFNVFTIANQHSSVNLQS
jgi:hypothetical protein